MEWVKRNWREIAGWLLIAILLIQLFGQSPFRYVEGGYDRLGTFDAFALIAVIMLGWLWLNRKRG